MKIHGQHNLLGFDIDDISIDDATLIVNLFLQKFDLSPQSVCIIWTGNGLHILIPTTDTLSLTEYQITKEIKIEAYGHIAKALKLKKESIDPHGLTPWLAYGRVPFTRNEKPGEKPKEVLPLTEKIVLPTYTWEEIYNKFLPTHIRLEGIFQKYKISQVHVVKQGNPRETPLIKCKFIEHCVRNAEDTKEPERFTSFKVLANIPSGRELAHTIYHKHEKYDKQELNDKFDRAQDFKYISCKSVNKTYEKCHKCPHFGKIHAPGNLIQNDKWKPLKDINFRVISPKGIITGRVDYPGLVQYILELLEGQIYRSTHFLYVYREIYWKQYNPEEFFIKFIRPLIGVVGDITTKTIKEVFANVKVSVPKAPMHILSPPEGRFYFKNGVLETTYDKESLAYTKELVPHTPNTSTYFVLPFDYEKVNWREDGMFTSWLDSFMEGDDNGKRRQAVVQEHVGHILQGAIPKGNNKALFIYGGANNGKSEFFKVISCLLYTSPSPRDS